MSAVDAVDRFQRKHAIIGFPLAVVYKYFDDQGPYLGAIITYYAFIAIFPLLLISSSVLGFILQNDPGLSDRLINTALSQFPIIGDQLGRPEGLKGSTTAIVIGTFTALYGALGLGQACQNAAHVAWSVPRNSRANPISMRLRSLVFLATGGLGVLTVAVLTSVLANTDAFGTTFSQDVNRYIRIAGFLVSIVVFMGLFRLVSGSRGTWLNVLPGAILTAALWQTLQLAGQAYVSGVINRASQMNSTFALVLGLLAFVFIAAMMGVVGLEVNVVAARHLYPRALLTPFTDNVDLTAADQRAYEAYAKSQRHKGFQSVTVRFEPHKDEATADHTSPVVEPVLPAPDPAPAPAPVVTSDDASRRDDATQRDV